MLTALRENGELLCLGDGFRKEYLKFIRQQEAFYCPHCKDKVILKLGEKRIFHFSHLKDGTCPFEHENESQYHLDGKLQLYQWLTEQKLQPQLEYYDRNLKQRADLIFSYKNRRIALEYQCSPISEQDFRKRNEGYISNGYHPFWILGGNQWKRKNTALTSLSDFHYLFLQTTSKKNWILPFYCSTSKKIIIHSAIQPISIRNAFSNIKICHIDQLTVEQLFQLSEGVPVGKEYWIKELEKMKAQLVHFRGSYQNPFLKELYHNQLNVFLLPPFIGIPVHHSSFIQTPPLIWQSYVFIDLFLHKEANTPIKFHDLYFAIKKRVMKKEIILRKIPLIEETSLNIALLNYLEILSKVGILKRVTHNHFELIQPIVVSKSVMGQKKQLEEFYHRFEKALFHCK